MPVLIPAPAGSSAGERPDVRSVRRVTPYAPTWRVQNPLLRAVYQTADPLLDTMTVKQIPAGEALFRQGEPGTEMYFVLAGKVKLTQRASDVDRVVAVLAPGDECGAVAIADGMPHTTGAVAISDTTVTCLTREALQQLMARYPHVSSALLHMLAHRLRRTRAELADTVFLDAAARVAKHLLRLGQQFGVQELGGLHIRHELTQTELGQLVGSSRETVNKILSDFAARGWIRFTGNQTVLVLDVERLARRAR
jgi:CRP-like cAMP-binding protein